MQDNKGKKLDIEVELSAEVASGVYSNTALIAHSQSEFVIDFIQILPGIPKPSVKSRIILTPLHVKKLLAALADNVAKFEQQFGKITDNNAKAGNSGLEYLVNNTNNSRTEA